MKKIATLALLLLATSGQAQYSPPGSGSPTVNPSTNTLAQVLAQGSDAQGRMATNLYAIVFRDGRVSITNNGDSLTINANDTILLSSSGGVNVSGGVDGDFDGDGGGLTNLAGVFMVSFATASAPSNALTFDGTAVTISLAGSVTNGQEVVGFVQHVITGLGIATQVRKDSASPWKIVSASRVAGITDGESFKCPVSSSNTIDILPGNLAAGGGFVRFTDYLRVN